MSICLFCCEEIGRGSATTPCCFQTVCTTCLLNNVAKNVGTEQGSTRSKCPFCRVEICGEVEPSHNITTRLNDLEDWSASAAEELEKAERTEKIFRAYVRRLEESEVELTKSRDAAWHENEALEMNLIEKSRIIGVLNHDIDYLRTIITTSHQFADHLETHDEDALESSTKIQSWWRGTRRLPRRARARRLRFAPVSAWENLMLEGPEFEEGQICAVSEWSRLRSTHWEGVGVKYALNKIEQDIMTVVQSQGLVCDEEISVENILRLNGKHVGNILSLYGQTKKYSGEAVMDQRARLVKIIHYRDEWISTSMGGITINGWSLDKISMMSNAEGCVGYIWDGHNLKLVIRDE